MTYECLKSTLLARNPYWEYRKDLYRLPNGTAAPYYYVHSRGSVLVIPEFKPRQYVLVRQYRYLNRRWSVEFPGGGWDPGGAEPLEEARRELLQETGFQAEEWIELGRFNPCNGMTDEECTVFLARGLHAHAPQWDQTEELEILLSDADRIEDAIRRGEIWDGMSLAAWLLYRFSPHWH